MRNLASLVVFLLSAEALAQDAPAEAPKIYFEAVQIADPGGKLTFEAGENALKPLEPAMGKCVSGKSASASGLLVGYLVFDDKGKVADVKVGGLGNTELEGCVQKALKGAVLSPAGKGRVHMTVDLQVGEAAKAAFEDDLAAQAEAEVEEEEKKKAEPAPAPTPPVAAPTPAKPPVQPGGARPKPAPPRARKPVGKARFVPGNPQVSGALGSAEVRKGVKDKLPMIGFCYEKLSSKPSRDVRVVVSFDVAADGLVKKASASGPDDLAPCVVRAIQTVRFSKPRGGGSAKVTYPFVFRP
jgi:hypothetical protein